MGIRRVTVMVTPIIPGRGVYAMKDGGMLVGGDLLVNISAINGRVLILSQGPSRRVVIARIVSVIIVRIPSLQVMIALALFMVLVCCLEMRLDSRLAEVLAIEIKLPVLLGASCLVLGMEHGSFSVPPLVSVYV